MKYKSYDTHCHVNSPELFDKSDKLIKDFDNEHIYINVVGTCLEDSVLADQIAKKYPNCSACLAIHPNDVEKHDINVVKMKFEELLSNPKNKIVAIGECGLDFYYTDEYKELQYEFLDMHLELANKYKKPLMLHIRNAHQEIVDYLNAKQVLVPIIFHCFSQDLKTFNLIENLLKNIKKYYSIPGIVTFKNAKALQEVIPLIKNDELLVETDAPYLTPHPFRGKENNSLYLKYTIEKIAELKNMSFEQVQQLIFNNAFNLFKPNMH
ncbi:TatD family hydrolase [Mycoplasma bradburyae]|uniref:TatD family hydrolase n=1 Tax=Mycoplasma bradburyae TaxID=2963128 RepID=A0AAW6HRS9_9MOLU|nr:TatD family hydrolase [Mycoplasma bradburyae]MDC4183194.1 TatD family hydrolase [Mycoplasma bradburyae]